MPNHVFISYSSVDGVELALRLANDLPNGLPPFKAWVDKQELHPGLAWDDQIAEAIRGCKCLLIVISEDSVGELSVTKEEWTYALRGKNESETTNQPVFGCGNNQIGQ